MKILLTGGAGFVGTNFTKYMLDRYPDYTVINLAAVHSTRSANNVGLFANDRRYVHVNARIEDESAVREVFEQGIDVVVNLAALTHVDASLKSPLSFIQTNVVGTQLLLELARSAGVQRFVQISSAEVYGPSDSGQEISETTRLSPSNPYAVSKASSDLLALSYLQMFGMDVVVTRCTNNYGPFQTPDKLVPLVITNALRNLPIPLYGDGGQTRDWLHVQDHCAALDAIIHRGSAGSIYNIASNSPSTTKQIVETVLELLDRPRSLVHHVPDRPGNTNRHSLSIEKLQTELGWKPAYDLRDGLRETADWYLLNREWWS